MKKIILFFLLFFSISPMVSAEKGDVLVRLRGIAIVPDDDTLDQLDVGKVGGPHPG